MVCEYGGRAWQMIFFDSLTGHDSTVLYLLKCHGFRWFIQQMSMICPFPSVVVFTEPCIKKVT